MKKLPRFNLVQWVSSRSQGAFLEKLSKLGRLMPRQDRALSEHLEGRVARRRLGEGCSGSLGLGLYQNWELHARTLFSALLIKVWLIYFFFPHNFVLTVFCSWSNHKIITIHISSKQTDKETSSTSSFTVILCNLAALPMFFPKQRAGKHLQAYRLSSFSTTTADKHQTNSLLLLSLQNGRLHFF